MNKKIILILSFIFITGLLFSEQLKISKKEPEGLKIKPLFLVKINYREGSSNPYLERFFYIIGLTKDNNMMAIDITYKSQFDGMFFRPMYNDIYVNFRKISDIDREILKKYFLSTWYTVSLKNETIKDEYFLTIKDSSSTHIFKLLKDKYKVDTIFDSLNIADYQFRTIEPVSNKGIIFIEEKTIKAY